MYSLNGSTITQYLCESSECIPWMVQQSLSTSVNHQNVFLEWFNNHSVPLWIIRMYSLNGSRILSGRPKWVSLLSPRSSPFSSATSITAGKERWGKRRQNRMLKQAALKTRESTHRHQQICFWPKIKLAGVCACFLWRFFRAWCLSKH